MGLFQKQPITHTRTYYELASDKTLLVVGLGNISGKYEGTRHNIGFDVTDAFADNQEFPQWSEKKTLHSSITSKILSGTKVILAKPTTYMNNSGKAVAALHQFYKIKNSETLVIADELDISFGQIRARQGGSSAGHNGLQSIIDSCGDDFYRIRIGIGPKQPEQMDNADFVLQKFSKAQQVNLDKLRKETVNIISEFVYGGGKLPSETRSFIV
jgi:PTH1 family peptidyl-tRNA hydrolase